MAGRRKVTEETAPDVDYLRASRLFAEGRGREEVEALCPGVDLNHPQVARDARAAEETSMAVRGVDRDEIKRRLLEIAVDDKTPVETTIAIYFRLLDH